MNSEWTLREKLRKIEALFAGAATDGGKRLPEQRRKGSANVLGGRQATAKIWRRRVSQFLMLGLGSCSLRSVDATACDLFGIVGCIVRAS